MYLPCAALTQSLYHLPPLLHQMHNSYNCLPGIKSAHAFSIFCTFLSRYFRLGRIYPTSQLSLVLKAVNG